MNIQKCNREENGAMKIKLTPTVKVKSRTTLYLACCLRLTYFNFITLLPFLRYKYRKLNIFSHLDKHRLTMFTLFTIYLR